ncbi:hypothetical protein QJS10_CPA01g02678 [Acorus calamus]|uniref:Ubiquitin-like domain-containing protein n=1 Tax=Acorus calamus TaxID=4465 RepID=A0AAV9FFR0_ACOCL|nr:hypothetical protein QJS10_CPA01g02678 [Acorus calamus]
MKEKVQKYIGIPISEQTLIFDGIFMSDEHDTEYYGVLQGSRIQVSERQPMRILVKVPHLNRKFSLEVYPKDTVARVKDKVRELEGTTTTTNRRMVIFAGLLELDDSKRLTEYGLSEGTEVWVFFRLKVVLQPAPGKRCVVEVNPMDKVRELRKEVERVQRIMDFSVQGGEYFFIHKQNLMMEEESFDWHNLIINRKSGVPPARQTLWARGVEMRDSDAVRDYTLAPHLEVAMQIF